jgi:fatty acid/phospholipid biosynthesis enzyme
VGRLDRGALQRADRPALLDLLGTASDGAVTRVHIGARTDCAISTERVCM